MVFHVLLMLPVVHHPAYVAPMPKVHRFPMGKFGAVMASLLDAKVVEPGDVRVPDPAPRAWLETVHDPAYVEKVMSQTLEAKAARLIGFPITAPVAERARAAVGGTVLTARLALEHGLACNTAGGSHHGFRTHGSGFCIFNDVAVAAKVLLEEGRIRSALVVDLDVHQGDGTASIFRDEPRVFTFSMHCRTNFPVRKQESDLDLALNPGLDDHPYLQLLGDHLPGLLDDLRPHLVFFNAGVDPYHEDRLGRLALTREGLWRREHLVLATCHRRGIPVCGVLGGGYAPDLRRLADLHTIQHQISADLLKRGSSGGCGGLAYPP